MANSKTINRITDILRDSGLLWLLPNLRQDFVIWSALKDLSFLEKVIQSKPDKATQYPADFSPGKLALLALDLSDLPTIDLQNHLDSIDEQAVPMAMLHSNEYNSMGAGPHRLASAGLVALKWINKYNAAHTWNGLFNSLPDNAHQSWMASIACLFSFVGEPTELLHSLVGPGSVSFQHQLAVHAILSNPLTANEQVAIIMEVCHAADGKPLPASERVSLLHTLSEQRLQIGVDFSKKWLEIHPDSHNQSPWKTKNPSEQVSQLLENLFQAEVMRMTGEVTELPRLLDNQLSIAHNLYTGTFNRYLDEQTRLQIENSFQNDVTENCNKAFLLNELNLAKNINPANQAELTLILARQGKFEEANKFLPAQEDDLPDDVDILFALAKVSFMIGNHPQSWKAAARILELLEQKSVIYESAVGVDGFSLVNLGMLLVDLHKPTEASRLFEHALQTRPNEADLLKILANCYKTSHEDQKAADTLNTLVALNPDRMDYHRNYAQSLEDLGDWDAALNERLLILESNQLDECSHSPTDKYDYARCAIKANKAGLALKVCTEILTQDREDCLALIYSGDAYLQMNETEKGMEFLSQATQIAPARPDAWLALVEAQKKIYPIQTVIETLRSASQAVPDSAQIHYLLGDLYIQDQKPTLALPELQSAVGLSPDEPQYLVNYGGVLTLLGYNEKSREIFARAYRLEPDFPGLAQTYAQILVEMGELEEAIAPLETLINSKTVHEPKPYMDYARCILILNKLGSTEQPPMKALIALNQVLQIDPDHAEAKALTAEALTVNGENELSFQAYREALDTSLTEDKGWFERLSFGFGCVASAIGKQDIAIAAFQEAGQANPNNPAIFMALSDAYISANLPEEALSAARDVLILDGDNPDKLAWFANQVAKLSGDNNAEVFNPASSTSKEVINEALSALAKAIQLAPTRTDLLVQLGNFQVSNGDGREAQTTFASIALLDFATADDLICAAKYLSEIGDYSSAIACLDKGISIDQNGSENHDPSLYTRLAQEYVKNHDHPSAINTLDKAIELIPDDSSLISLKVDILLGLGQPLDALNVIETCIHKSADNKVNVDLLFLASLINRSMGDFAASIKYALMGAAADNKVGLSQKTSTLPLHHLTHLAEIYRAILQPKQAYQILQDGHNADRATFANEQDYLDYIFLHTELALETGERLCPEIQNVKLEAYHTGFSRLMALNSRLMNKAGNSKQAEQLYQLAINKIVNSEQSPDVQGWSAPYHRYLNLLAMVEAAQDLGLWDQAMSYAQQMAEASADEPLPQLNLAKTVVLKAEFNHLCEVFEVTRHKPSIDVQANDSYAFCKQYLDYARTNLKNFQGVLIVNDHEIPDEQINRWQSRAEIIFGEGSETSADPGEFLAHLPTPGDIVAVIHHLRHSSLTDTNNDAINRIIKLARDFPRNPSVILQVVLAVQASDPQEALKSLQSVVEHNPYSKNPGIAFCNILLARLGKYLQEYTTAQEAVEKAIAYWPDEDSWHRLAAEIYQQSNDISHATHHWQEAANLAPKTITYRLELGQLLFDNADDNTGMLNQARTNFESVLSIEPNNAAALIHLANTYYQLSEFDKAEAYARKALTQGPDRADLYQLLSKIVIEKNDYQGAYEYANKAIQISPKDIQSTVMLAKSLSAMGKHTEALAKLNALIPLVQEARALHIERVNIISKVSGPQIALNELKSLTTTYPDDFSVLNALAKSFFEIGELENAVGVAEQALRSLSDKTSPNEQANLHLLIGQVLRQSGQLDQSIRHLNDAIQLAPDRLEPYLELGLARKERREYQQALQIFEQATVMAPDDPRALYQAGLALKESKDYKSSENMLRRAVSLAPNDLAIRRQLAAVVALNLIHNPRSARINAK